MTIPILSQQPLPTLTGPRRYRLEHGVRLIEVSVYSGIQSYRVSQLERDPSIARPGELARMRAAIDQVAAQRRGPVGVVAP